MSFITLKVFKTAVENVAKLCSSQINSIRLILSKEGLLSFIILLGLDVQILIPLEFKAIKPRGLLKAQSIDVAVNTLTTVVRKLPVVMEEVEITITPAKLTLSGGYNWSDQLEDYANNIEYSFVNLIVDNREFVFSEEQITCFDTSSEIAEALKQAEAVASKKSQSQSLTHINLMCVGDLGEILVRSTDGHKIYQKQLYALDTFSANVDVLIAPQLGKALSKLMFAKAHWQIYQNFVKVTLDTGIKILAARSLSELVNFSKYEDRSQHVVFVVNPHELKSRLSKIKKDVTLHIYSQDELLAIEYLEAEGDGVGISWVKTQKQPQPAYTRVTAGLLNQALKQVKKTTKECLFRLPKFSLDIKLEELLTSFLEFDGNSYLVGEGVLTNKQLPVGVQEWFIGHGFPIIPESQPISTVALSIVDLSSRWDGKGWQQPEIVECECGSTHDLDRIKHKTGFKLFDYCSFCEVTTDLDLECIDYSCTYCGVNNQSTPDFPLLEPICMECGKKDFTTTHTFSCDCGCQVEVEGLRACYDCDSVVQDYVSWHCSQCLLTIDQDDLSDEAITECAKIVDGDIIGFTHCPLCLSEALLTSTVVYVCTTCGTLGDDTHVPGIQSPLVECPDCEKDIPQYPREILNDPFVVGDLIRV